MKEKKNCPDCPSIIFNAKSRSLEDLKLTLLFSRVLSVQETLASSLGNSPIMNRDAGKVNNYQC